MLPPDYQAALDAIFNHVDYERRRSVPYDGVAWDLERTRRVLSLLGDPQRTLRFVHVAGSKGKGSTAACIEAVLRAAAGGRRRTGFYTSPHLHTFRERIRIDGQLLARADLVRLLEEARPAIESVPGITTFEIITVLALLHFAQQEVDWVVLEVGLGGRLDATNVVTPAVSVITPISHEHTALLGTELDQIAREKAGIIKPGVPVVSAPQPPEALGAIQATSIQQGARLVRVGRDWQWQRTADGLDGQTFDVFHLGDGMSENNGRDEVSGSAPPAWTLSGLRVPLLGAYQVANATTAVATCWELVRQGVPMDEADLRQGLAGVVWPGRLEVLSRPDQGGPAMVVDSAHNRSSVRLLRSALEDYFPGTAPRWIVGISNDKDVEAMLGDLLPGAEAIILVRSRHPRATDPQRLALSPALVGAGLAVATGGTVAQGLQMALDGAGPATLICATGSLFVAAEAREAWLALHPDSLPAGDWARQAEPVDPTWQVAQAP